MYHDAYGKTLSVWIGDPSTEDCCEEADDDTILMRDATGAIIGFEKLNVVLDPGAERLTIELVEFPGDAA